jgi:hypothetical protein
VGGLNYNWLKSNNILTGATSQNFTPSLTGNYKVKITDSHGCNKTSSAAVKVTVNKKPSASINLNGSANICNLQTKIITASGGLGSGYIWMKDGNYIAGASAKTFIAGSVGNYSCIITNVPGCTATSNTITITSNCKENDEILLPARIQWIVYPNPASNQIHIELKLMQEQGNYTIEIRNLLGELILDKTQSYSNYNVSSDLSLDPSLSNGVYFIILRDETSVYRYQFLIEHP